MPKTFLFDVCAHRAESDPEFAKWLQTKYKPIAGGWMY